MPEPWVSIVIPTLRGGAALGECVESLENQTWRYFEIVIVDNSGQRLFKDIEFPEDQNPAIRLIENDRNVGFGAAINQVWRTTGSPYIATLNDDAVADPFWLGELVQAMGNYPEAGMCASRVLIAGEEKLDSAGMLISGDGSSKQRGRGEPPDRYAALEEVLLPSGSAAIFRRQMLDEIGGFDESFFLYCEDTDLGLRGQWAGWKCFYVPTAVVEHRYSQSAGSASPLKAYYVERNRMFVALKNFPASQLWRTPFVALVRYAWHVILMMRGEGAAADYRRDGNAGFSLVWIVLRAHWAVLGSLGALWRARKAVRAKASIKPDQFTALLRRFSISPKKVAEQ